jgi:hypothetical protein
VPLRIAPCSAAACPGSGPTAWSASRLQPIPISSTLIGSADHTTPPGQRPAKTMSTLKSPVETPNPSRVEHTYYGIDYHFISDEAFDELLEFLKEESEYEYPQDH